MGASGSKQGRLTAGCWPLRLRRGSSSPATKATASTQTDVESSLTGSGLVKGGAAADAAAVVSGAPLHAAAPSLGLPRPAVPPTPARDVRFSLDSMAGSEYGLESARPPAARLVLSAAADDVSPQRQLPMVEEPSGPQAGGEWEEAERLTEVRSSLAAVQGGHPGLDSITQLCAKASMEAGQGRAEHGGTGVRLASRPPCI